MAARSSCSSWRWRGVASSRRSSTSSSPAELVLDLGIEPDLTRKPVWCQDEVIQTARPNETKEMEMEQLLVFAIILIGFAVLGAFALTVGADSRDFAADERNPRPAI